MENQCICNATDQTKELACHNCQVTWTVALAQHEITSKCPEHSAQIAICGGRVPCLCSACKEAGFYLKADDSSWFPKFSVMKGEPNQEDNKF